MAKALHEYKSPSHKVFEILKNGRDGWREKYGNLKSNVRKMENQVRAVERSRQKWRQRAEDAEAELRELKKTIGRSASSAVTT